ncbi:MAG: DnaT-like ssDNA-binding protein [Telluria sp.]
MALIVETGAIVAGAESLCSVATADTYHSDRANTAWAALTTPNKEAYLRRATEYMTATYRKRWKGVRMSSAQTLDWPRGYVYLEPVITGANQSFPNLVASNIVPVEAQRACAELALKASSADLLADLSQGVKSKKVGPIEITYDERSPQTKRYVAVDRMLKPYLSGSDSMLKVVRA